MNFRAVRTAAQRQFDSGASSHMRQVGCVVLVVASKQRKNVPCAPLLSCRVELICVVLWSFFAGYFWLAISILIGF